MSEVVCRSYISGDYAGITVGTLSLYYGYEFGKPPTDEDDEDTWGFLVRNADAVLYSVKSDDLIAGQRFDKFSIEDCFLRGVAFAIRDGVLTASEVPA